MMINLMRIEFGASTRCENRHFDAKMIEPTGGLSALSILVDTSWVSKSVFTLLWAGSMHLLDFNTTRYGALNYHSGALDVHPNCSKPRWVL